MKDKRKDGKQKHKAPAQHEAPEGLRRKRLKPVNKAKYKINRYQLSEDPEEEFDPMDDFSDEDDD